MIRNGVQRVLDVLLPQACPACEAHLPPASGLAFCATCYATLPWWNPALLLPPKLEREIETFSAPLLYLDPLRDPLRDFKFADRTHYAPLLARLLFPHLPGQQENLVLVPVPMHPKGLRKRTYNHAALLVRELGKLSGIDADLTALKRIKAGPAQHGQSAAARRRLSRNHFACHPRVAGKTVILIDDIFTTGATAAACAGALKQAGAKAVHVRTLAYTPPGE